MNNRIECVRFSNPETQRFAEQLYKAFQHYPFVSVYFHGNNPDLGSTERSLKYDIETAVVLPDAVFGNRREITTIANYLEGLRNGNEQLTVWLENHRGYRDFRELRCQDARLVCQGKEPVEGFLGGWGCAQTMLMDIKKVSGAALFDSPFILSETSVETLPADEADDVARVAFRDVLHGLTTNDYVRIAKGHIKSAMALVLYNEESIPSVFSMRDQYGNFYNRKNYHMIAMRMLTDPESPSQEHPYSAYFTSSQRSVLEISRILRSSIYSDNPFNTDPRFSVDEESYRSSVVEFVTSVSEITKRHGGPSLFIET